MTAAFFDEWGHPVTEADVCGPEDFGQEPAPLPELHLDTDDPWTHWMIAELIIAFSDEMQSETAPW